LVWSSRVTGWRVGDVDGVGDDDDVLDGLGDVVVVPEGVGDALVAAAGPPPTAANGAVRPVAGPPSELLLHSAGLV
jgi:hypothetical protein